MMTAADVAKTAFMSALAEKAAGLYGDEEWGFYKDLLKFVEKYRADRSGYISPEYKRAVEEAKKFHFHIFPLREK
jgi:hypothetical protein